ncbi:MAG: signal peptidase II [Nitrospirota bacterium]
MKKSLYISIVALSVVFLDQLTKYFVNYYLDPLDRIEIFSFLHLVNVRNTGAAFGMFKSFGNNFFIIVSSIAIVFMIWLLFSYRYSHFGLSLVLGGAIGNLIDRILCGKVIDFIDFSVGTFHWPAFNVADSSLTIGIVIVLISPVFRSRLRG